MLVFHVISVTEFEERFPTLPVAGKEFHLWVCSFPDVSGSELVIVMNAKAAKTDQLLKHLVFWVLMIPCCLRWTLIQFVRFSWLLWRPFGIWKEVTRTLVYIIYIISPFHDRSVAAPLIHGVWYLRLVSESKQRSKSSPFEIMTEPMSFGAIILLHSFGVMRYSVKL